MATTEWESDQSENEKGMWVIFPGLCKGCGLCIEKCPVKCISWSDDLGVYGTPRIKADMTKCIMCGMCQMICPEPAIRVEKKK